MEIIPAILPKNFNDLIEKLSLVKGIVPLVQIDITDGVFVPSITWPFNQKNEGNFEKIKTQEEGIPFWDDFDFELDLMIKNPEENLDDWINTGASRMIIHIESTDKLNEIIEKLNGIVEIGVAINIDTPNEKIYPYLDKIDFVQFMGIEKIGFQGEPFSEKVLGKIKNIREKRPGIVISVDGGVDLKNAEHLKKAGTNRVAVGSSLFKSSDIIETVDKFKEI